jgi:transposase
MTTARCHVNYVHNVMVIMYMTHSGTAAVCPRELVNIGNKERELQAYSTRNYLDNHPITCIILLTLMNRPKASKASRAVDPKAEALRQQGALHPKPDTVQDEAFHQGEFFDARDLVQVRYEMLRRHQVDGQAVTAVAVAFGVSRQAFYTTETAFEQMGISGLLPRRRGPQRAHKCTDEVLDFVERWRATSPTEKDVTEAIQRRFGVSINPRSIERALTRRKKKRFCTRIRRDPHFRLLSEKR